MNIFPAIDLVRGCAVRLFKGDYDQMTVYSEHPEEIAVDFEKSGAKQSLGFELVLRKFLIIRKRIISSLDKILLGK